MNKKNRTEDFMKITGGILDALEGAKDYSKEKVKVKIEYLLETLNFVKRDDFEVLSQMCIKINEENQHLKKQIKILEKKLLKTN